jgi:hypothetical protein
MAGGDAKADYRRFRANFGSDPIVFCYIWDDFLCGGKIPTARLSGNIDIRDINSGHHEQMKPLQLHASREAYRAFSLDEFRNHIDREKR